MEVKKKKIKHYGQRSAQMDDASWLYAYSVTFNHILHSLHLIN